jgi:hypothetical protein
MYYRHKLLEPIQVSRASDTILHLISSFMYYFKYTCNGETQKPMSLNILDKGDCCIYQLI